MYHSNEQHPNEYFQFDCKYILMKSSTRRNEKRERKKKKRERQSGDPKGTTKDIIRRHSKRI